MKRTSLVDSDRRPGSGYFGRVFRPKPATSLECPVKDPNLTGQIVSACGMPRSLGAPYFSTHYWARICCATDSRASRLAKPASRLLIAGQAATLTIQVDEGLLCMVRHGA
ncbi:hypothetical protein FPOAC2_08746 [Fusarium poae]